MFRTQLSIPRLFTSSRGVSAFCGQTRRATIKHGRNVGRPKGVRENWTPEKLALNDKYPLTAALNNAMHPEKQTRTTKAGKKLGPTSASARKALPNTHVRTQIVSPNLCDDILNYIGRTLEQHKGCDILDINPGACLWSQKLHEFLKPRSHILLEPNPEMFKRFLDPLLDAPGSKYKLVTKDPKSLSSYREMVDEGCFPHQTRIDPSDSRAQDPNHTLLVIGSLAWDPRLPGMGFDSMAKQLFHHFASAAWTNDLFHAFGPVRTLLWVQNDDFSPMIAQGSSGLQKANCHLEMTHELNLVVRAERHKRLAGRGSIAREPQLELESLIRALKTGEGLGMELPPHRRDFLYDFAKHFDHVSGGSGIIRSRTLQEHVHIQHLKGVVPTGFIPESFVNSTEHEMKLRREYPDVTITPFDDGFTPERKTRNITRIDHPAFKEITEFKKARSTMMNAVRQKLQTEEAADIGEELYLLECEVLCLAEGPKKGSLLKKIEDLDNALDQKLLSILREYRSAAFTEIDDRLNLRHPPHSRIQWDKRPYEPLIMYEEEVWPQNRLSLVSAVPKPKPMGASPDWFEWLQDFIFGLYAEPSRSVSAALDAMQHGLSDIVKECPSMTDPKAGGRLLMKHLRVRMLTMEMLNELVQAYRDWPFKAPGTDHNKYFRHKGQTYGMGTNKM